MTGKIAEKLSRGGNLLKDRVINRCPYGDKHFCNGDPNPTAHKKQERPVQKKPCIYFENGRCQNKEVRVRGL